MSLSSVIITAEPGHSARAGKRVHELGRRPPPHISHRQHGPILPKWSAALAPNGCCHQQPHTKQSCMPDEKIIFEHAMSSV